VTHGRTQNIKFGGTGCQVKKWCSVRTSAISRNPYEFLIMKCIKVAKGTEIIEW